MSMREFKEQRRKCLLRLSLQGGLELREVMEKLRQAIAEGVVEKLRHGIVEASIGMEKLEKLRERFCKIYEVKSLRNYITIFY